MELSTILFLIFIAPLLWGLGQILLGVIIGIIGMFLE